MAKTYETFKIHVPAVAQQNNVVEVHTLSTIPEFLQEAITVENHRLTLDNVEGKKTAPLYSVIGYERSAQTKSGYNCWFIGQVGVDLVKVDGVFYTRPPIVHAMLIPAKEDAKPIWANSAGLTYNGDIAMLETCNGNLSGRVGRDFILCYGMGRAGNPKPKVTILTRDDKSFKDYVICDDEGSDICLLSECYPA